MNDEAKALHLVVPESPAREPKRVESRGMARALLEEPSKSDHVVQFYEDEEVLVEAVSRFTAAGLDAGEPVLIVATPDHRAAFVQGLRNKGCDAEAAIAKGQLTLVDARETLQCFMLGDAPDWERFRSAVGPLVEKCGAGLNGERVRIYGEMVDLLWRGGNRLAAIRLEEFWNNLARTQSFSLLCAYAMGNLYMPGDGELFSDVCERHSHILQSPALQIQALKKELEHRKTLEAALRARLRERTADAGALEERNEQDAERFRLLVASVEEYAIFMLDPQGYVASWNMGAERIKGYRAEEIIGQHFSRFYPPGKASFCEEELRIAARDGRFEDEGWRVRKDGTHFWANVLITRMLDRDGKLVGFAKVTRDLTQRRSLEEERIARITLERALDEQKRTEELREQLIGVVGHDLRTPLSSITMGAALMLKRGSLQEADVKVMARIARSADRMAKIISQLLDFTRARLGGGMKIEPRSVDLADVCADVIAEMEAVHPECTLSFDAEGDAGGLWDRSRLAQVVSNLVGNAVEHGKPAGAIHLGLTGDGESVTLTVHNEGPPIPAEFLPAMFDPFRRHQRANRSPEGLGLGLYICRQLVLAHGGDISVHSTEAAGTTFTVRLPRQQGTQPAQLH